MPTHAPRGPRQSSTTSATCPRPRGAHARTAGLRQSSTTSAPCTRPRRHVQVLQLRQRGRRGRAPLAAACGTMCKCFSSASVGTVVELLGSRQRLVRHAQDHVVPAHAPRGPRQTSTTSTPRRPRSTSCASRTTRSTGRRRARLPLAARHRTPRRPRSTSCAFQELQPPKFAEEIKRRRTRKRERDTPSTHRATTRAV